MLTKLITPHAYRTMMRHVPAAVSIIAAGQPGSRNGLTVTAVCSLSDKPPSLLVCVHQAASALATIIASSTFSLNVLAAEHEGLAETFAGHQGLNGEARFSADDWEKGVSGAPVLKRALCSLECNMTDYSQASTHTIIFGEVVVGTARADAEPLVYKNGGYFSLPPLLAPVNTP